VKRTAAARPHHDPALEWSRGLKVEVGGAGVVAHAGVVLPRLLADRIGLTVGLRQVVARRGFTPGRDRGRLLTDTVSAYDLMCRSGYDLTCRSRHGDHGMVSPPATMITMSTDSVACLLGGFAMCGGHGSTPRGWWRRSGSRTGVGSRR
jgi:hypothetical protein